MLASDKLVSCAYNMAHEIYESRLQYHLVKCRKAHSGQKKHICVFDSTHHVDSTEQWKHEMTCPNRRVLEESTYYMDGERTNAEICARNYVPVQMPPPEEDWDDDPPYIFDPEKASASKPVIRVMNGGTRSERREFRQKERIRMQKLTSCLPPTSTNYLRQG